MIKNLLELNEVQSEVFGEHLQGGVGDLQAIGIVRVMVADDDYERARNVVTDWELSQPVQESELNSEVIKRSGFGSALVGFILGAIVVVVLTQTAVDTRGVDYDGDGRFEQKWEYVNQTIRSSSTDRNRDGEFDEVLKFDFQGHIKKALIDNDFDGRMESECRYRDGVPVECLSDIDGDGFNEHRENFSNGVLSTRFLFDRRSYDLRKKQYFQGSLLIKVEVDLDGDGVLETSRIYDEIEEEID
jgi:hypothetical protein